MLYKIKYYMEESCKQFILKLKKIILNKYNRNDRVFTCIHKNNIYKQFYKKIFTKNIQSN